MSDLGGGIALQEEWDFEIDNTGDLRANTGIAELQKDVAFSVASALGDGLGSPVSQDTRERIDLTVQSRLLDEDRVTAVRSTTIRQTNQSQSGYEVVASVDTAEGPFDLVFEVEL